jgi:hypothetical protein
MNCETYLAWERFARFLVFGMARRALARHVLRLSDNSVPFLGCHCWLVQQ